MKHVLTALTGIFVVVLVLSVPRIKAQDEDMHQLLKQLEDDTDRFSKELNKALDSSPLNGTNTEDEINGYVKAFEESTDRLKKDYEKEQDHRVAAHEVVARAKTINTFLKNHPLNETVTTDWVTVRTDLNRIAKLANVKPEF